ncbi:MAG: hypothetical protein M3082_20195 [Candidatus Dormibacteraeota bacterium]|nr:hypothetical protein [Candidatus Dormibacteraeota bacterium]
MKGRKLKTASDPSLARAHAAGAKVIVLLPSLHETYGLVNISWPHYWVLHLQGWQAAHDDLVELDAQLLELPVDESDQRTLLDDELRKRLYGAGNALVVNAVLTFSYLILEVARISKSADDPKNELSQRLIAVLKSVGFGDVAAHEGWSAFIELHKYRDALMHPAEGNVYGGDDGAWATVPLAWYASGRAIATSTRALQLASDIATFWEAKKAEYDTPATLTVRRGIRSLHQFKKPPKKGPLA